MSLFYNFKVQFSEEHICIVFIARTHQTRLLPYISMCCALLYLNFWFVSYVAATAKLQLTFAALHYVEAIIP